LAEIIVDHVREHELKSKALLVAGPDMAISGRLWPASSRSKKEGPVGEETGGPESFQ
jgi:hypothetical protein